MHARLLREVICLLQFALVGAGGFVVDWAVLQGLSQLGVPAAQARLVSIVVAMHTTFLLNGLVVFRQLTWRNAPRRWLGYMAANGLGAVCNYGVFLALTASGRPWMSTHLGALAGGTAAGFAINYVGTRLLAFRRPAVQPGAPGA